MQRREFLAAASAVAAAGLVGAKGAFGAAAGPRQYFELRTYRFKSADKQQAFEQFLEHAAVPALNRAGVEPVGIWKIRAEDNEKNKNFSALLSKLNAGQQTPAAEANVLYVLLPHDSFDSVLGLEAKLAADAAFQKQGAAVLRDKRGDSAFERYDSTLLLAMEGAPRVQVPNKAATRIHELRTYQSRNVDRAINKLEMFNKGEFPLFAASGMPGVFFGGAIAGQDLPQLTYMVTHEKREDIGKNWKAFGGNPNWKPLSSNPKYQDNVSQVVNLFVRPTAGTQI